jgi:hypothetical protein
MITLFAAETCAGSDQTGESLKMQGSGLDRKTH